MEDSETFPLLLPDEETVPRCVLEKNYVPLEVIAFQPARSHTRIFGFRYFQSRYTQSDAGTLSGPLEPTVTGMLIVRYYQNGELATDRGRIVWGQLAYLLLVRCAVRFMLGE